MKKFILILLVTISGSLFSQNLKIGIVDVETIGNNISEAKEIEADVMDMQKRVEDSLKIMQANLQTEFEDYQKQQSMMPADQKAQVEQQLGMKQQELQAYYQRMLGPQGEIARRQLELLEPVRKKINKAIEEVAKANKINIVLDKSNPSLLYSEDTFDITYKVLDKMKTMK